MYLQLLLPVVVYTYVVIAITTCLQYILIYCCSVVYTYVLYKANDEQDQTRQLCDGLWTLYGQVEEILRDISLLGNLCRIYQVGNYYIAFWYTIGFIKVVYLKMFASLIIVFQSLIKDKIQAFILYFLSFLYHLLNIFSCFFVSSLISISGDLL